MDPMKSIEFYYAPTWKNTFVASLTQRSESLTMLRAATFVRTYCSTRFVPHFSPITSATTPTIQNFWYDMDRFFGYLVPGSVGPYSILSTETVVAPLRAQLNTAPTPMQATGVHQNNSPSVHLPFARMDTTWASSTTYSLLKVVQNHWNESVPPQHTKSYRLNLSLHKNSGADTNTEPTFHHLQPTVVT